MTAREIEAYEPPPLSRERPQFRLGCGGGLYKLYTWTGAQSWQHRVRMPGVNTWITLGECGRTSEGKVDCSEARKRLALARQRLAAGEPPEAIKFGEAAVRMAAAQKEKAQSSGPTFGEIAEACMAQADVVEAVQKHRRGQYSNYLKVPLGSRPIAAIEQDELVVAAKAPLAKSASGRPALTVPQSLAHMIQQIYDYGRMARPELVACAADAHVDKLMPKSPPPQHRPCIVDPGELGALLRKIRELYFNCRNPATGLAMRMLPLVALRPGEVCRSVWDEVDLNKRLWLIPVDRMKMRRAHLVPLSYQTMAILNEAQKFSRGNKNIFSSYSSKKCDHVCLQTPIQSPHSRIRYRKRHLPARISWHIYCDAE